MKKLVEDMVLISILLVISLFCRRIALNKIVDNNNIVSTINQYSVDVVSDNSMLYLMSDDYARNDMVADNIKISNSTNGVNDYKLYLRLDDSSTLDIHALKVLVNDIEYNLSDLYEYEVDGYRYYYIYNDEIKSEDNITFKLWLSNSLTDNVSGNSLIYSFVVV